MVTDLLTLTCICGAKLCPMESFAALLCLHLASSLFSTSFFINGTFVAPTQSSLSLLLTCSARSNAANEVLTPKTYKSSKNSALFVSFVEFFLLGIDYLATCLNS